MEARRLNAIFGAPIYLPTIEQAKFLSMGFRTLTADYYWVKSLQYYMDPANDYRNCRNLSDLLNLVVGVDPEFKFAYKFGGYAIPFDTGGFKWVNTEQSTDLLERGVSRFPNDWQLRFVLGYNYLNYHDKPKEAAEQFAAAGRLPGSPAYLSAFAARLFAFSGSTQRAIEFAKEVLAHSEDPTIREMMEKRLADLHVEERLQLIEKAAKRYKESTGNAPTLDVLVREGYIETPPSGYSLDESGIAHAPGAERMVPYQPPTKRDFGTASP